MLTVIEQMLYPKKNDYKNFLLIYNDIVFNHLLNRIGNDSLYPYNKIYDSFGNHRMALADMGFTEDKVGPDFSEWYYEKVNAICKNDFPTSEAKLRNVALRLFLELKQEGEMRLIQWREGIDNADEP